MVSLAILSIPISVILLGMAAYCIFKQANLPIYKKYFLLTAIVYMLFLMVINLPNEGPITKMYFMFLSFIIMGNVCCNNKDENDKKKE